MSGQGGLCTGTTGFSFGDFAFARVVTDEHDVTIHERQLSNHDIDKPQLWSPGKDKGELSTH